MSGLLLLGSLQPIADKQLLLPQCSAVACGLGSSMDMLDLFGGSTWGVLDLCRGPAAAYVAGAPAVT